MGAKSSKVKGVGSGKQQIPSFPEPLSVRHLLTPGLLCNGQVQWAKAMANIGRARANGVLGATKEAPRPGNPTIGQLGNWNGNMIPTWCIFGIFPDTQ